MKAAALLGFALIFAMHASAASEPFYVAAKDGIYRGAIDSDSGQLAPLVMAQPVFNPSFLAQSPTHPVLYTASGPNIVALSENPDGSLNPLAQFDVAGKNVCHFVCDNTGHFLLAVDYDQHVLASIRLDEKGKPYGPVAYWGFGGSGPNKVRQEASHPHGIYLDPENRHAYMCDLGSDRVWMFKFDAETGKIDSGSPHWEGVKPGSGPRHLAFSPDGSHVYVYVNGELGANLSVFARDKESGNLTAKETVSTLTPDRPKTDGGTAEIVMHPSGKWLYVTNRLGNTIAVFAIGPNGEAKLVEDAPSLAQEVWSIQIDATGRWLIAAGRHDNRLVVFKIDAETGKLTPNGATAPVNAPICVLFVPDQR